MMNFKDKTVETTFQVLLALAVISFIIFLICQMIDEERAAAEFFRNR